MSEEIKKEAQDVELNQEGLDTVAGGGFFDIIPYKKCISCNRTFTVNQASTIVNNKCPHCGGTIVNYSM